MTQDGAIERRHVLGPAVMIFLNADRKSLLNIEYITGLKTELEYPSHVRILNAVGGMQSYKYNIVDKKKIIYLFLK